MKKMILAALAATSALTAVSAQAATTFTDLGAWQAAAGSFNRDTTYGTDFTDISSLTLDDGTQLGFAAPANIRTIGSGWATWSGGYTGQVLFNTGGTTMTIALNSMLGGFGLFVEPDPFGLRNFTMILSDGSTAFASYDGNAGAGFFGFVGNGITSVQLVSTDDFAVGDIYTTSALAGVPEPATWGMMILGFGAIGGAMRRRKAQVTTKISFA